MTGRTEYTDGFGPASVLAAPPCPVALVLGAVRDLNDPRFPARLADSRRVGEPAPQSHHVTVLLAPLLLSLLGRLAVLGVLVRIAFVELRPRFSGALPRAIVGTVF